VPENVADLAREVLQTFRLWRLPVNPFTIAKKEGIELAQDDYGDRFDARIEYYPTFDSFCIYHQIPGGWRTEGRVRFSLAHELGHYYLPHHNRRLRDGKMHNSVSDYRSKDPMEQQADEFAAAILMPLELFRKELDSFRCGFCDLKDLGRLADRLGASITSTARRYCQADREPCTVFFSQDGVISWGVSSTDMKLNKMYFYEYGTPAPARSKTANLWDRINRGEACEVVSGTVDAQVWFQWPRSKYLWEEVMPLGNTGVAITQLTPES
jgi:hypothetical protein